MLKLELTSFNVRIGDRSFAADVPMSVYSELAKEDSSLRLNCACREDVAELLCEACEITASFTLSSEAARLGYAFFEVPDLDVAAKIIFNGSASFSVSGGRGHRLNVSGLTLAGENTLVIKLPPSDAPRVLTVLECIGFRAFRRAHIAGISAKPIFVSSSVSLDVSVEFVGDPTDVKAVATLISPSGKIYYGGVTNGRALINVAEPLLWWPGSYGVHNLYKLNVNLYYENEVIDSSDVKIGLRSVFLDERERSGITVNGAEFLAMGAEYVMDGISPALAARSRAADLVSMAVRANMNYIRYRGEGRYPCEEFLNLCDKEGIALELVIRSSKLERGDENAFRRELAFNMKRLARHPSVICLSYEDTELNGKYESIISEVRSSTSTAIIVRRAQKDDTFLLPPSVHGIRTLRTVIEPDEMNIFSYSMEHSAGGNDKYMRMLELTSEQYKYAGSMDELIYTSGVLQAHAAEAFAREARISRKRMGSALLSVLSDSAPVLSSAAVDFCSREKPVMYMARRFFAPVCAFVKGGGDGNVKFFLSNETRQDFSGALHYSVRDRENSVLYENSVDVSMDKFSAGPVCEDALSELIKGRERECYLEYSLEDARGKQTSSSHLFVPPKHFRFAEPEIFTMISGAGCEYTLTFRASAFAKDVVFSFTDSDAAFEENCVDITSSVPKTVRFITSEPTDPARLTEQLRVMSVYDVGRSG